MAGVSLMDISEIKVLVDRGKYPQALEAIGTLKGEEKIEGLLLKFVFYNEKGNLKKP